MNALQSKVKEVGQSLLPIVGLVLLLIFGLVPVDLPIIIRFLLGAALLFLGLSIFLWGIDQSMNPIGHHMAGEVATSKRLSKAVLIAFLMGFLVTVAEPDLLILGGEVEHASGGQIGARYMVLMVSLGVGILIALAALRTLLSKRYNVLMGVTYGIIFILAVFVSEEFLAIAFDSSGATTGALTTPFILALSVGLSRMKGGQSAEEDSFGMVGAMSAGPILAVCLMSILSGTEHIQGVAETYVPDNDIFGPILRSLPVTLQEALIALIPLTLLFFFFERKSFRLPGREIFGIVRGLIYSLIGLTFFLTGANAGFMDMGRLLGMGIAENHSWLLPLIGLIMGLIVVLAEPAVHVLGEQIEEVSAGHIPLKLIRLTLSIGVGIAICLSMVRIMIPEVKLWYFLLPGFAIAVLLSFVSDPIFVGIAYDAGGVASGPMAATFVLAFAQGAADKIPTADVMVDGFGVIAMIAMAPVLSLMILGTVFQMKKKKAEQLAQDLQETAAPIYRLEPAEGTLRDLIFVMVDRGHADDVVTLARSVGARGATILHGRDARAKALSSYSFNFETEKEVILLLVNAEISDKVANFLLQHQEQNRDSHIVSLFVTPVDAAAGLTGVGSLPKAIDADTEEEDMMEDEPVDAEAVDATAKEPEVIEAEVAAEKPTPEPLEDLPESDD